MKTLFKVMGVVAICAVFAVAVYNQVNAKQDNPLFAKNIEALTIYEAMVNGKVLAYCDPYILSAVCVSTTLPNGQPLEYPGVRVK